MDDINKLVYSLNLMISVKCPHGIANRASGFSGEKRKGKSLFLSFEFRSYLIQGRSKLPEFRKNHAR